MGTWRNAILSGTVFLCFALVGCGMPGEGGGAGPTGTLSGDLAAAKSLRVAAFSAGESGKVVAGLLDAHALLEVHKVTPAHALGIPGVPLAAPLRALTMERASGYDPRRPFAAKPLANVRNGERSGGWKSHGRYGGSSNGHGFVFLGGSGVLSGATARTLLDKGGYEPVAMDALRAGDLVIYENGGTIEHSGIVVKAAPGGRSRVLGKWGAYEIYEHDADVAPASFGSKVSYFRAAANPSHIIDVKAP